MPNSGGLISAEHDWKTYQASSISSCSYLIPLHLQPGGDNIAPAILDFFKAELHQWIALAFAHTCITTPFDDFVYVMSLERTEEEPRQGYAIFELSLLCHVSDFIWAFQEWSQFFVDGRKGWKVKSRIKGFTGDQVLRGDSFLGSLVPHRINRTPPTEINIRPLVANPRPFDKKVTTSILLHVLTHTLTAQVFLWDDAHKCPDLMKLLWMATRVNDRRRFSWGDIRLDRRAPESWEYVPE